jgi:hypothetical protein
MFNDGIKMHTLLKDKMNRNHLAIIINDNASFSGYYRVLGYDITVKRWIQYSLHWQAINNYYEAW